ERNVPTEAIEGLRRRGHAITEPHHPLGGGQAVLIDWEKGTLTGASDPRKDGMALGY
ncbi:MAG: gamma-glutamyltransferase, partial [Mesorhizobium sp.]